jgi:F0F1-type ATP synthase delta subunit
MADLAFRYAEALLTAAKRENALPVVTDEMQFLACEFSRSADVFRAPVFAVKDQLATVDYVLGDKYHPLTKRFICLLASMHRLGGITVIADTYVKMALKEMGQIDLYITAYEETTPEMASEIVQGACEKGLFESKYKDKLSLHITADKGWLGGVVAECDGLIGDWSLRTRLLDMSQAIRKI